jgi:hypothetical protein
MSFISFRTFPRAISLSKNFYNSKYHSSRLLSISSKSNESIGKEEEKELDHLALQSILHAEGINLDTYYYIKKSHNFSRKKKEVNLENNKYEGFLL